MGYLIGKVDRNLNAVDIRRPFWLGLEGCVVDRSQDIGWQRTFVHGDKSEWTPSYPGYCLYYSGRRHMAASLRAFVDLAKEIGSRNRAKAS